jgi:hypothetical protein
MYGLYVDGQMSLGAGKNRLSIDSPGTAATFMSHGDAHLAGDLLVWGLRCEPGNLHPIDAFSGVNHA